MPALLYVWCGQRPPPNVVAPSSPSLPCSVTAGRHRCKACSTGPARSSCLCAYGDIAKMGCQRSCTTVMQMLPLARPSAAAMLCLGLLCCPAHHSAFLQQVSPDACTTDVVGLVEVDLNQLAKPAAVVITLCLGIAERFQDGVGLQHKQPYYDHRKE